MELSDAEPSSPNIIANYPTIIKLEWNSCSTVSIVGKPKHSTCLPTAEESTLLQIPANAINKAPFAVQMNTLK